MIFQNRADAGRQLAQRLMQFADRDDVLVLGVPRGGVVVAYEVAATLHAPLDVLLARKLGVPGHEELAFGAVAIGGGRYLDDDTVRSLGISDEQVERVTQHVYAELDRRAELYRGNQPPPSISHKVIILVDDGIATGASVFAAIEVLRRAHPAKLILAVPVAPRATWLWLRTLVDAFVVVDLPEPFGAVGAFYRDFTQVEDHEVVDLLRRAKGGSA